MHAYKVASLVPYTGSMLACKSDVNASLMSILLIPCQLAVGYIHSFDNKGTAADIVSRGIGEKLPHFGPSVYV